jgi:long-chain fatty acid transport protein
MMKKFFWWVVAIALCGGVVLPAGVHASGFAILEQGVRGLGNAYSGSAALAEDPSTIFYNPAGLTRLSGHQVEAGIHLIIPKAKFRDQGSLHATGQPLNIYNDLGGDGGETAFVPNFYYAHSISERFKAGIGIHAPYGLKTEYNRNWVGRYHAVESDLKTININPSAAFRFTDQWSVGAGVSIQYADATLSNKADLGFIGASVGVPGATPQGNDAFAEVSGDDWGYGYNLGLMFEPTRSTRLGLAYRSKISHTLKGNIHYEYEDALAQAIAGSPLVNAVNGKAQAKADLPETLSLGAYHALTPKWAVLAGVTWTRWSRLEELRITYDTGQADTVVTLDWDDTWRFDLGVIYSFTKQFTGRFGVAYDQSPVPNPQNRTPRIPDEDRYWVAVGAGYKFGERAELNIGYVHIFVDDPKVNKQPLDPTDEDFLRGALVGKWDASVDIISLNFTYAF